MAITRTVNIEWQNPRVRARLKLSDNPHHHIYLARQDAGLADSAEPVMQLDEMDDGTTKVRTYASLNARKAGTIATKRDVGADKTTITTPV